MDNKNRIINCPKIWGQFIYLWFPPPRKKLGVENIDNLYFMGDLSTSKIERLYNKCDIFVMLSNFEAFGIVFVEDLISGLPCIRKNCYEMPCFIRDGETLALINNNDSQALSKRMYAVLSDEKHFINVEKRRGESLMNYSLTSVAEKMAKVIIEKE